MREHEMRRQVVGEMHLRRWPLLSVPGQIVQWVLLVADDERAAEQALLDELPDQPGAPPAGPSVAPALHRTAMVSAGVTLAWERHSEGSSLALFAREGDPGLEEAMAWAGRHPGKALRATRIALVEDDAAALGLCPGRDHLLPFL